MLPGTGEGAGEGQTAQGSALGPDWTSSLIMKGAAKVLNQLDYVVDYLQWTVPLLSIMIIYNCTWSILIQ